ncbi:MAG: HipA family kinase [Mucilaginibacter sp.]
MKELLPIRSEGYMDKGGSTKPWKIITINPDQDQPLEIPYVLKLFTKNQVTQQNPIGKEFLCNFLASEFDLIAPECGVVRLSPTFLDTLEKNQFNEFGHKYQGHTFASRLCTDAILYTENMPRSFPIKDYVNIFTFDCLTFNADRGGFRNKPNILVDDDGFILIDHELTFFFSDGHSKKAFEVVVENIEKNTISPFAYNKHVFYRVLKHYKGSKKNIFDEARESLKNLNINAVNTYISNLEKYDIKVGSKVLIIDYLSYIKQNSDKYINILLGLIS